jgi:DNA-binding NtrC family response regulator
MYSKTQEKPPMDPLLRISEDFERRVIIAMLERCNWNQTDAAEQFHVPVSILKRKMKRLKIDTIEAETE